MTNDPIRQADIERRLSNLAKARRCGAKTRAGHPCRAGGRKGPGKCMEGQEARAALGAIATVGSGTGYIRATPALFRLHSLVAAGGAGRRYDLEPTASWRRYLHLRIQSSRGTDYSLGSRQFVAQGFRTSSSSDCRRLALDVRRTCDAVLRHYLPLVFGLRQRGAHARENSDEQQETHGHIPREGAHVPEE